MQGQRRKKLLVRPSVTEQSERPMDTVASSRNVPSAWNETSYSYLVFRDVNTHTGNERGVMYRSSFRTFPSFFFISEGT